MNSTWGQLLFYGIGNVDVAVPYDYMPRVVFCTIGVGGGSMLCVIFVQLAVDDLW
ncbi:MULTISPECIES: hypothetical protein [Paenibacillus]|uniref:hypothetical protein n=1 Tax=Paenibacillus TaxID=44249 RepID=UPI0004B64459|nr:MULTISPECIES: hypothetical protein [Paenibacillus]